MVRTTSSPINACWRTRYSTRCRVTSLVAAMGVLIFRGWASWQQIRAQSAVCIIRILQSQILSSLHSTTSLHLLEGIFRYVFLFQNSTERARDSCARTLFTSEFSPESKRDDLSRIVSRSGDHCDIGRNNLSSHHGLDPKIGSIDGCAANRRG